MEEKNISEQESLELITKMINQTKQESAVGSGNVFLVWGYLSTLISLVVYAITTIRQESGWGWLFMSLPVLGVIASVVLSRRMKKKYNRPTTYAGNNIAKVWLCLSFVFFIYACQCLMRWNEPQCWSGMFLLGLLLPGIGTYCTGTILKEEWVQRCGVMGSLLGCYFLAELCGSSFQISTKWCVMMAFAMIISLVIPGHILNYKAKKANAK